MSASSLFTPLTIPFVVFFFPAQAPPKAKRGRKSTGAEAKKRKSNGEGAALEGASAARDDSGVAADQEVAEGVGKGVGEVVDGEDGAAAAGVETATS